MTHIVNDITKHKMKKNILIICTTFLLFGCEKYCEDKCKGFDFDSPMFQWYLFPKEIDSINFTNSNDTISLIKESYSVSQPKVIEYECTQAGHFLFGNPNFKECQESINSKYSFSNEKSSDKIYCYIYYSTTDKTPRFNIDFQKGFNLTLEDSTDLSISKAFYDTKLVEEIEINGQKQKDVLIISANELAIENTKGSMITKLWIIKGKGLVQFKIDDNIPLVRKNIF